jgi:hypothetical protein
MMESAADSPTETGTDTSAVVPKSYPGTEMRGICCPIVRSIARTIEISSGDMNV